MWDLRKNIKNEIENNHEFQVYFSEQFKAWSKHTALLIQCPPVAVNF